MQKLIEEVEKAKIMLSEKEEAFINIPFINYQNVNKLVIL